MSDISYSSDMWKSHSEGSLFIVKENTLFAVIFGPDRVKHSNKDKKQAATRLHVEN